MRAPAPSVALVLALGVSVTTCRLDKLIHPTTADRLTVSPGSLRDSAHVGSSGDHTLRVFIQNADGPTLGWTATKSAVWVELGLYSGNTPDSVDVIIHPDTLSQTLHQDTIVFVSTQTNDSVRVPLAFNMLPAAAELDVDTTSRVTTAFVGNAQPDTFSLQIKNPGALPLTWTAAFDTTWVTLSDSGSTVPPNDLTSTVVLATLRPAGLAVGTHRSTVTFTAAAGTIGSPDLVHVTYTIIPCVEKNITPDVIDTSSIALSDCGAPQRPGRQAKLYAVQANLGDTLSFRLTAAFNPWLILTDNSGATVLDSVDVCGAVNTACIVNYPVTVTGKYVLEATTRDSGETGAFTLSAVRERAPSPPAPDQFRADSSTPIGVGTVTPDSAVVFKATLNDPNPRDSVQLVVELEGLTIGPQTYTSAFVLRGTPVALRVNGLKDNEGYHWRARTCDNTGRCSTWFFFGGNNDPAVDFFVNWKPENPTMGTLGQAGPNGAIPLGGGTTGTRGNNVTVTFSAGVTDPDPGDQISIEVEYKLVSAPFDSSTARGSGVLSGGTATQAVSIPVPILILQTDSYHWRARVCDQTGRCSVWVGFGGNSDVVTADTDFHVP